jgi:hypothetical protein
LSLLGGHPGLDIVHRKVLVPAVVKLVTALVFKVGVVIVAVPAITDQLPVPISGKLPANVTLPVVTQTD